MRKVRQFESPAGESVILAHRLLKNSIKASEYVLLTDDFYQLWGNPGDEGFESGSEHCEGIGNVSTRYRIYEETTDSVLPVTGLGRKLGQMWRYHGYTLKKLFGRGHKGEFKVLKSL